MQYSWIIQLQTWSLGLEQTTEFLIYSHAAMKLDQHESVDKNWFSFAEILP